ncbi:MFS transporter [Nocardioides sp. W7]|uniref:MFS transporter n=1 Tax=Nocardioides sp. W7 TaxID=2931390 RepID=UPI001FD1EDA4|nr:MFS transporter [Nocardioides sp. W7]
MASTPSSPDVAPAPLGRLAALMGVVVSLGPVTPYLLSALGPVLIDELDVARSEFGTLWTVSFGAAVALSLGAGRLCDRLGPRNAMTLVLTLATAALVLLGLAEGYWWIVAALVLSGAAQSGSGASTNLGVIQYVPPARRSMVVGVKQAAVQAGQLSAGLIAPVAAVLVGWRVGFLVLALVGVASLVVVHRLPHDPRDTARTRAARRAVRATAGRRLPRPLVALVVHAALTGVVLQATNVYLPLFAHDEHGFSAATAGLMTAALGAVGIVARLAWARRLDGQLGRMGRLRSRLSATTVVGVAVLASSAPLGDLADSRSAGIVILLSGVLLFGVSAMAATLVVIIEVLTVVPGRVGWASSYVTLGMMSGFMVGPMLFGVLLDGSGGYALPWIVLGTAAALQWLVNDVLERGMPQSPPSSAGAAA